MEMTKFSFLLYLFPVMLVVYYPLSRFPKAQNLWLVICSVVFYAFHNVTYVILLLAMTFANFALGVGIYHFKQREDNSRTKKVLVLACAVNIVPLVFYKHLPSLVSNVCELLHWDAPAFPAIPLGLSFLTLRGISYAADLYRGTVKNEPTFLNATLYLTFFPALQAGPIVRYHQVAGQIESRAIYGEDIIEGLYRFIVGLAKTVLLAKPIMAVADMIFSQSNISGVFSTVPVALAWLGVFAFGVGAYHYFSGFSDLAIGLGQMLGFPLPENFRHPHLSASVGEFWERCFTSLVAWFEDYVYEPLEKGRRNNDWMVIHTLLMWVLIGFWLGPGIPNIIFAIWSMLFILVERIIELDPNNTKSPLRHFFVILFMLVALVSFKTESMYQFTLYIANLFGMRNNGLQSPLALQLVKENALVLAIGFLASFPIGTKLRQFTQRSKSPVAVVISVLRPVALVALVALTLISLSNADYNPNLIIQQYLWS